MPIVKRKSKKKIKLFETFTKAWVTVLMIAAVIDLQLSYVLAFLGRDQIAESLSVAVVTEIIGVMGVYLIRAWMDSATESKHSIIRSKINSDTPDEPEMEENSTEAEG